MNALEQQLDFPLGEALPAPGTCLDVSPGVRWARMTLPFALDHVNVWLLRDGRGWTLVDCGIADDATRAAWERLFAEALDGAPVTRVIATHMHPDHLGLAGWLTERWNARLWISATDHLTALLASRGLAEADGAAFMASHGLADPAALDIMASRGGHYGAMVPRVPAQYRRLLDGDTVRIGAADWTCIAGYGHSPEHMSLHDAAGGVLISGDMVLPRISTNVSVHAGEPEGDALAQYLASLRGMRALPADTLVLPSHGRPFRGLHTRIDQLLAHHEERLAEVLAACAEAPRHAADLLQVLFRRTLDAHQTTFAMGESIAHLHGLWHAGRLVRERGADGVFRFSAVSAPGA